MLESGKHFGSLHGWTLDDRTWGGGPLGAGPESRRRRSAAFRRLCGQPALQSHTAPRASAGGRKRRGAVRGLPAVATETVRRVSARPGAGWEGAAGVLPLGPSAPESGSRCTSPSVSEATCRHRLEHCGRSSLAVRLGRDAHGLLSAVDPGPGSQSSQSSPRGSRPDALPDPTWGPSRPLSSPPAFRILAPASSESLRCGFSGTLTSLGSTD